MARLSLRVVALGYLLLILIGPLGMMVWRTAEDLDGAWTAISDPNTVAAFKLTLTVTAVAVAVNTVFGIVCALLIVRGNIRGRGFLNAFVDLPLSLSPVIVGFSLIALYGIDGWFGWFQRNGFEIIFATPAIVLATIFVTLPFVVREVVPTLREIGTEQEQAAHTLGASGWQTFWRITLPSIRWAVVYGVVLTTARAVGEYGAVALVSGNIAGQTQTATLRVEDAYQFAYGNYAPAYGIAFVLAATAILVLVVMIVVQPRGARH
ncbi:MAG TPA: sulfate ABC transporter permease subunit [Gaiellaceae bacterium]|nr:sulfate ABC transporter permease subunit [Gaiellaceae bacterium]